MLSVIIPAYNEEQVIDACLSSVVAQEFDGQCEVELIVAANGCIDNTVKICQSYARSMAQRGIQFRILDIAQGNKNHAINTAEASARYSSRLYLDADVVCEPTLFRQIIKLLDVASPRYASGCLAIQEGGSFASRAYGKIWRRTPYIRDTIPGCGCYAVNGAGRQLWDRFPAIHSDDKFVRLLFRRSQRRQAIAKYFWPLPQGFVTLIKIRIRWIYGNRQLAATFPELRVNDSKRFKLDSNFIKTVLFNPLSTLIFTVIYCVAASVAYSTPRNNSIHWSRAR